MLFGLVGSKYICLICLIFFLDFEEEVMEIIIVKGKKIFVKVVFMKVKSVVEEEDDEEEDEDDEDEDDEEEDDEDDDEEEEEEGNYINF